MTEQVPPTGLEEPDSDESERDDDPTPEADVDGPTTTGVPAVDQVLSDVDRLDEAPLEEHLATFERAHDTLRSALDAPPGDAADREPSSQQPGDSA
jgi:hypothetical protein